MANEHPEPLAPIIADAWRVFGFYRITHGMVVCTCPSCMTEATRAEIIATPAAELTVGHIREYTNSAHGVPANQGDMKAMLPRYMELIAENICPADVGWELALARFGAGRAEAPWPPDEAALLDRFLRAAVIHAIGGTYPNLDLEAALIMTAAGGCDLDGLIAAIMAAPGGPADVAELLLGRGNRLQNLFWESYPGAEATVMRDIASAEVQQLAHDCFEAATDDAAAETALHIIETGERLAQKAGTKPDAT